MLHGRAAYAAAAAGGTRRGRGVRAAAGPGLLVGAAAGIAAGTLVGRSSMAEPLLVLVVDRAGDLRHARGVPGHGPGATAGPRGAGAAARRARGAGRDHPARPAGPARQMSAVETVPALLAAAAAWLLWRRTTSLPMALFGGLALWWLTGWAIAPPRVTALDDEETRDAGDGAGCRFVGHDGRVAAGAARPRTLIWARSPATADEINEQAHQRALPRRGSPLPGAAARPPPTSRRRPATPSCWWSACRPTAFRATLEQRPAAPAPVDPRGEPQQGARGGTRCCG